MTLSDKVSQLLAEHPSGTAFNKWQTDASVSELRELVLHAQTAAMWQLYVDPARLAIADKLAQQAEATADKNLRIAEKTLTVSEANLWLQDKLTYLTKWIMAFTVILFIVAVLQVVIGILQFP